MKSKRGDRSVQSILANSIEIEKNARCMICNERAGWRPITYLPKFLFGKKTIIIQCNSCKVGKTVPPPETNLEYYECNHRNVELFTQRSQIYLKFAEELLDHLESVTPPSGRLLDFGCGGGFVVQAALQRGYDAEGIEANMQMLDWCQTRGLRVFNKSIDQLIGENKRYEVIVFSAVLEHLEDPISILKQCKQLLTPNGIIVIAQASYDGLLPRLFPWGWYGWQPQEHYWHFSAQSLRILSQRCDLHPVRLSRGSLHHPWFKRGSLLELLGRNLAALVARLGLKINMGDNIYLISR